MKSLLAVLATLLIGLLSSCASPVPDDHGHDHAATTSTPGASFNDADVMFTSDMIPHHQQAVELSALVPSRSTNPAVVKLAADISAGQGPEIETMKALLSQWTAGAGGHQDHGAMAGDDGMVDAATMTKLESLKGAEFDTLWLQSMVGHHQGAIAMAKTELASGANADAKALAQQIVAAQESEITQMKQMLGG